MWPATRPTERAELVDAELVEQRGDVLDGVSGTAAGALGRAAIAGTRVPDEPESQSSRRRRHRAEIDRRPGRARVEHHHGAVQSAGHAVLEPASVGCGHGRGVCRHRAMVGRCGGRPGERQMAHAACATWPSGPTRRSPNGTRHVCHLAVSDFLLPHGRACRHGTHHAAHGRGGPARTRSRRRIGAGRARGALPGRVSAAVSRRRTRARGCETVRGARSGGPSSGGTPRWPSSWRRLRSVRGSSPSWSRPSTGAPSCSRSRSARPSGAARARRVRGWRRTGTGMPMRRSGASSGRRPSRAGASPR